jgi:ArsR family transcriptional regulator
MAMKAQVRRDYELRARIVRAMGHPSRLLMLDELAVKELCVCELTGLVGSDQSTVSKHLAVLRNAGLVDLRKQGAMVFYRLKVPCLAGFWGCIEAVASGKPGEHAVRA